MQDYLDDALFLVEDGYVSEREMLEACLKFMDDDDIREMLKVNAFDSRYSEYEIDPDESSEWQSFDPDC